MAYKLRLRSGICAIACVSLLCVGVAGIGGCNSNSKPADSSSAAMPAGGMTSVMKSGGTDVLKLSLPPNAKCASADGSLKITSPQYEVEVWLVRDAQSIDAGVGSVKTQIVDEFKDFKPEHSADLNIAGSTAKRLVGSGHEADDNDPGDADVIVFKVGDHVFVACTHGESLTAPAQQALLTVVQTAQVP